MSGRTIQKGATNISSVVRIIDSTAGTPETGVTSATGGLAFNYRREAEAAVAITAVNDLGALTTAHTDGGLLHIGDGYYRIDFQDAAFATGAGEDGVLLTGTATGMIVIGTYHPLVDYDPVADITTIASDIVILVSDTTAIHSQTTVIESDSIVIESNTEAIHSQTTVIESDSITVQSSLVVVESQTTVIESNTEAIHSQTTVIESDSITVQSSLIVIESQTTVIESNTEAIHSQTTVIESDSITVQSSLVVVESQTTVIESNTEVIETSTTGLTYTVAGEVDVNIKSVIDDPIQASSTKATEWGGT